MGYYFTTSPENAVPANSGVMPKTHTPGSPVKERGLRYYSTEIGRWTSRDPIEEEGGAALFCAFGNDGIDSVDFLGLESFGDWVKNRATTVGGSATGNFLPPIPFGPGTINFNVTGAVEKRECCSGCTVYEYLQFAGTIEVYWMFGRSFKKRTPATSYDGPTIPGRKTTPNKPGRNDRLPNPDKPGEWTKRKNHPGFPHSPESGYRQRYGYGENGPMVDCPKNEALDISGNVFIRGSVGLGFGGQFNVTQTVDSNFDIIHGWDVSGGWAVGTFGGSIDVGGGVTFSYVFGMSPTTKNCSLVAIPYF